MEPPLLPIPYIAEHFKVPKGRASNWVHQARVRQFLDTSHQGVAFGRETAKVTMILGPRASAPRRSRPLPARGRKGEKR